MWSRPRLGDSRTAIKGRIGAGRRRPSLARDTLPRLPMGFSLAPHPARWLAPDGVGKMPVARGPEAVPLLPGGIGFRIRRAGPPGPAAVACASDDREQCGDRGQPAPDVLERPARLLAGPGAGKTQALVDLYADLVEGGRAGREQILVLTFSTAAARELAERLDERLRDSYGQCYISTFHSFCARLMREWGDPGLLLMSGFQEWVAMRATLEAMDRGELGDLAAIARSDGFAQDALAFVALLKQNLVHPGHFGLLAEAAGTPRLRALARVFSAYQARLEAAGLRDFRDLVRGAIELLESRPAVLER